MPRAKPRRKRLDFNENSRGNVLRRPSLKEALLRADQAARFRANQRSAGRKGKRTIQATLSLPAPADYLDDLKVSDRALRIIAGLILIPLFMVSAITLFQQFAERGFTVRFWKTPQFFYFALGVFWCSALLLGRIAQKGFLYLYVLGHELTHVIFIYCSLGKVSGFRVGLDGGYVITNKSNVLIALSPYFVPFWSLVGMLIIIPLGHFYPFSIYTEIVFATLGATWAFHFLFTVWMIPRDQPDLKENDTFFSFMLILFTNTLLLSSLICIASPDLGWRDFVYNWANNFTDLVWLPLSSRWEHLFRFLSSLT